MSLSSGGSKKPLCNASNWFHAEVLSAMRKAYRSGIAVDDAASAVVRYLRLRIGMSHHSAVAVGRKMISTKGSGVTFIPWNNGKPRDRL